MPLESRDANRYMARMARIYQTRAWQDQLSPSIDEMELMALEAYAHLPEGFRTLTGEIVIQVSEFPTDEIMDDLALETPFETFFTAYEQYQRDAAAWDVQYGPRYGASQPGYLAAQAAARRNIVLPQAGVSDPTTTTAAKVVETGTVVDQTTGAEIPVIPVTPKQTSVPVVQPVAKDAPKQQ